MWSLDENHLCKTSLQMRGYHFYKKCSFTGEGAQTTALKKNPQEEWYTACSRFFFRISLSLSWNGSIPFI